SVPGPGIPLVFTRTYDAGIAQDQVASGAVVPPLGYGWTDNFDAHVSYNMSTQVATVTEGSAAQTTFTPYLSGSSPSWCTGTTNFCQTAPRFLGSLNHNSDGSWTYVVTNDGQTTYQFSSTGVLTQISDPAGDTLSSQPYTPTGSEPVCPNGYTCTSWRSSASGRQLVLE